MLKEKWENGDRKKVRGVRVRISERIWEIKLSKSLELQKFNTVGKIVYNILLVFLK